MEQWRAFDVDWENIATAADWVSELSLEPKEQAALVGDFALAVKDIIFRRTLPAEKWLIAGAAAFAHSENKKNEALMYNEIGLIYKARGDYDAALQWYQKSVDIKEALGDRAGLAVTLHNMGYIAKAQQDWPAALAYFTRSRELYQQIGLEKDVREEEELIAEVKTKMSKKE